jgi:lysophospholipase L1-like esterase
MRSIGKYTKIICSGTAEIVGALTAGSVDSGSGSIVTTGQGSFGSVVVGTTEPTTISDSAGVVTPVIKEGTAAYDNKLIVPPYIYGWVGESEVDMYLDGIVLNYPSYRYMVTGGSATNKLQDEKWMDIPAAPVSAQTLTVKLYSKAGKLLDTATTIYNAVAATAGTAVAIVEAPLNLTVWSVFQAAVSNGSTWVSEATAPYSMVFKNYGSALVSGLKYRWVCAGTTTVDTDIKLQDGDANTFYINASSGNAFSFNQVNYWPSSNTFAGVSVQGVVSTIAFSALTLNRVKSCLIIGDSITSDTLLDDLVALDVADAKMDFVWLGSILTASTTAYHDGNSGQSIASYVGVDSWPTNPFLNSGNFDFSHYRTTHQRSVFTALNTDRPDYVIIHLGINDISAMGQSTDAQTITAVNTAVARLVTMVNSILADSPSALIGICLPSPPASTEDAFAAVVSTNWQAWKFKREWAIFVKALIDYNWAAVSPNVSLVPLSVSLDTYYGFGIGSVAPFVGASTTVSRLTNSVHPSDDGKLQIANALWAWLKYMESL